MLGRLDGGFHKLTLQDGLDYRLHGEDFVDRRRRLRGPWHQVVDQPERARRLGDAICDRRSADVERQLPGDLAESTDTIGHSELDADSELTNRVFFRNGHTHCRTGGLRDRQLHG